MTDIAACLGREIARLWRLHDRTKSYCGRDDIVAAVRGAEEALSRTQATSFQGALAQLVLIAAHTDYMIDAKQAYGKELAEVLDCLNSAIRVLEDECGEKAADFGAEAFAVETKRKEKSPR